MNNQKVLYEMEIGEQSHFFASAIDAEIHAAEEELQNLQETIDSVDYYWNIYHVERTKLDKIDCEDYYFVGCRMGLHTVLEVVMQSVGE